MSYLTGYQLSKLINTELDQNNIKNIPAQMIYNYMKKGYIPTVVINSQTVVEEVVGMEFLNKLVAKKVDSNK